MDATTHHQPLAVARAPRGSSTGAYGEQLAAEHLTAVDGLELVARNWRIAEGALRGELDLVATTPDRGCLVVVEVRTRTDAARFGGAVAAVPPRKAAQVRRLAAAFLRTAHPPVAAVRLDLVAVDLGAEPRLTHVEAAL